MSRYMPKWAAQRDDNEPEIVEALEKCGWKVTRFSVKDWPDLHIGKAGHSIWLEVKVPGEDPTPNQWEQIDRMRHFGMNVCVVYSVDTLQELKII